MIENKVRDYRMHKIITRDIETRTAKPDADSAYVVNVVTKYLAEDGFHINHPDKNLLRCAFISPCSYPYTNGKPGPDNNEYISYFEYDVFDYDMYRFRINTNQTGEDIYFIPEISLGEAMSLAATYRQHTFIYKDVSGCHEICSKPFVDSNGNVYEISDVVRNIDTSDSIMEDEKDLGRVLAHKMTTWEVHGIENGNSYWPKDEFEFYYISRPRPLHRMWNKSPIVRNQYLLYKEVKSDNR